MPSERAIQERTSILCKDDVSKMSDVCFEEDPVEQQCTSQESSSGIQNIIVSIITMH